MSQLCEATEADFAQCTASVITEKDCCSMFVLKQRASDNESGDSVGRYLLIDYNNKGTSSCLDGTAF